MRNLSMFKFVASLFAVVLTVATPSTQLHAQVNLVRAEVNVPFAFEVGPRHFEAGVYTMRLQGGRVLAIRGASGAALTVTNWDSSTKSITSGKVVFHKYGDHYFLREVWTAGDSNYLQFSETKQEQVARKADRLSNVAGVQTVAVSASGSAHAGM